VSSAVDQPVMAAQGNHVQPITPPVEPMLEEEAPAVGNEEVKVDGPSNSESSKVQVVSLSSISVVSN